MRVLNRFLGFFSTRSQTEELIDAMSSSIGAQVRSDSINESARTVVAVAATDTPVMMFDPDFREVVDEILVAEGGSFLDRMPLLDNHDRSSIFKILGSASNAVRKGGEWEMLVEFDDDEDSENAFKKVKKRHVRDVSIGYRVLEGQYIRAGQTKVINGVSYTAGERRLRVATKWEGYELSLSPMGADRKAKIRSLIDLTVEKKEQARSDELAAELDDLIKESPDDRTEIMQELSEASGLDQSEVETILAGDVVPSKEVIEGFAVVLEADEETLLDLV